MECLMSLYDLYYSDIRKFKTLTPARQDEVFELVKKSPADSYYGYSVEEIIPNVGSIKALDLFKSFVQSTGHKSYEYRARLVRLCELLRKSNGPYIRSLIVDPNSCSELQKMILTYADATIDEEEVGLRALAKSKSAPSYIHDSKYQPRLDALKKLPSIMRLCCLETLTNQRYDSYNVFGNITDEEEFKLLLFSSTLKHRDRAEVIWNKYKDLVGVGSPGSLKISGTCKRCGDFELIFNSLVIKTKEALKSSRIGYTSCGGYCPFCSGELEQAASITEQEWIK
jgi:hypothetical protein